MIWFPKGGTKYFDKALRREFHSKKEKENFLNKHKLVEDYKPDKLFKKDLVRIHEEVEESRRKKGFKPRKAEVVIKDGFYNLEYREK